MIEIRPATVHDAQAVHELIAAWLPEMVAIPQQAVHFLNSISKDAEAGYICAENFDFQLGFEDGRLQVIGAMRDGSHLYHLFVARGQERRGWGRRMWRCLQEKALAAGNPGRFTVNASRAGLPFYHSLGFVACAPENALHGVHITPMRLASEKVEKAAIDQLITRFYAAFDNRKQLDLSYLADLFTPDARIHCAGADLPHSMSVQEFIAPRALLLQEGRLRHFHEWEYAAHTDLFGSLANRRSLYQKAGEFDGAPYGGRGYKQFHLLRHGDQWRICSLLWEDERSGLSLPAGV
ncbi:GNAT family N-acetyltransferase [Massilia sp. W12]|uniref:GNAT family N-acetyltransferase n=1 Tax=Massilia sp. W12 TaxID=3126507 RepID=UPI0030CE3A4F